MEHGSSFDWETYEQRMNEKFWTYLYRAAALCSIINALLIGFVCKYTHHPKPTLACIQLMLPLIIWELLIVSSFCPIDVIEFYLEDLLLGQNLQSLDMALLHLMPNRRLRLIRSVHSAGDVQNSDHTSTITNPASLATERTDTELLLTERLFSSPYLFTD